MAGVRFEISADPSQLTAALDAASAKVESWANSASGAVGATMASASRQVAQAKADLAKFNLEVSAAAEQAGLSNAKYTASIAAVAAEEQRLKFAVQEANAALLQQKAAADSLSVGGINLESMLTRIGFRFIAMQLVMKPVMEGVQKLIQSYRDQEEAEKHLDTALLANGQSLDGNKEAVLATTEAIARLSDFTGTQLDNAFAKIAERGHDVDAALLLIGRSADLAAGTGIKLEKAATDIGAALEGQTTALQNDGLALSENEKAAFKLMDTTERAAFLNAKLTDSFGGMAAEMDKHSPTWDHFTENMKEFGRLLDDIFGQPERNLLLNVKMLFNRDIGPADLGQKLPDDLAKRVQAALGGPSSTQAEGQLALESGQQKVVAENADAYDRLIASIDKLDPSLDKLGKRQAEINLQFAGAKKSIDGEIQSLLAGGEASTEKITTLERMRGGLEAWRQATVAAAGDDSLEKSLAKIEAAATKNEKALATAADSANAYEVQVAKLAGHDRDLDPYAAGLQRIDEQYRATYEAGTRRLEQLAKEGTALSDSAAKIISERDSLAGLEEVAREQYDNAYIEKSALRDEAALQALVDKATLAAAKLPGSLGDSLTGSIGGLKADVEAALALLDVAFQQGLIPAEAVGAVEQQMKGIFTVAGDELIAQTQKAGQALQKILNDSFHTIGSVIEGGILDGKDGIEKAFTGIFSESVKKGSKILTNDLVVALGGSPDASAYQGGETDPAYLKDKADAGANGDKITAAVGQGFTAVAGVISSYSSHATEAQVAASNAMTALAIAQAGGYNLYSDVAAVAYFVVSEAAHLLAPADNTGKFYTHINVTDNKVDFGADAGHNGLGYSSDQQKQIFESIQQTIDTYVDGLTDVLFKFPQTLADKLMKGAGTLNLAEFQNAWNGAASHGFNDSMNAWIANGLPQMIANNFWEPIAQGLEENGISASAAAAIHDAANKMVPKDAMKFISDTVAAVLGINDLMKKLSASVFAGRGDSTSLWQQASDAVHPDAIAALQKGADDLMKMGDEMQYMNLPGQVAEMGLINTALQNRYDTELRLIQAVQSAIENITTSYEATRRQFALEGMVGKDGKPDYQSQVDYLKKYLDSLTMQIATTTDPGKLNDLGNQINQIVQQIVSVGGNMGPDAKAAYLKWGDQALSAAQSALTTQLKKMGDAIDKQNAEFLKKFQPFIDAFEKGAGAVSDSTTATVNATAKVNDFSTAVGTATDRLRELANGHTPVAPSSTATVPPPSYSYSAGAAGHVPERTGRSQDDSDFREAVQEFRQVVRAGLQIAIVHQSEDDFPVMANSGR